MDGLQSRWIELLDSDSASQQVEALRGISRCESVHGLTARVVGCVASPEEDVRNWATEALESSVQPEGSEVTEMMALLQSTDSGDVAYWSATMLGRLGSAAAPATESLVAYLRESAELAARERAAWALCRIGPAASRAVPTLRTVADAAPPRLQRLVVEAIASIQGVAA